MNVRISAPCFVCPYGLYTPSQVALIPVTKHLRESTSMIANIVFCLILDPPPLFLIHFPQIGFDSVNNPVLRL